MIYYSQFTGGTWDTMWHYQLPDHQGAEIRNLACWVYMPGLLFHFIQSSFSECWWSSWCVPGPWLDHGWKLGKWRRCLFLQGLQSLQRMQIWKWIVSTKLLRARTKAWAPHCGTCRPFLVRLEGFGEEMIFQSQEFSRYTHIKSPSPGACAKAQRGKQHASLGVPISMAGMWV